jgi:hypothetical protein
MTLLDTLYPPRCPTTGQTCPRAAQARLLVCLPADTAHDRRLLTDRLAAVLRPYVIGEAAVLNDRQFPLWSPPTATETRLLLDAEPDPDRPTLTWCSGGPVGLLGLNQTATYLQALATDDVEPWQHTVAGTPAAESWHRYLEPHRQDPDDYPLQQALADFEAQPRIAAMAAYSGDEPFPADLYGPGLEAIQDGPDAFADYQAGLFTCADGLVDLNGQLLQPAASPILVEQSWAERRLFHDRVRAYLAGLDPTVVLAAAACWRQPTTQPSPKGNP